MGVAAAAVYRRSPGHTTRFASVREILPCVCGFICLLAITAMLPGPLARTGALGPVFALLILYLARGGGLLSRVLAWPVLIRLGEASYALYILQEPLWNWFGEQIGFVAFAIIAVGVALAVTRWFEPRAGGLFRTVCVRLCLGPPRWIAGATTRLSGLPTARTSR